MEVSDLRLIETFPLCLGEAFVALRSFPVRLNPPPGRGSVTGTPRTLRPAGPSHAFLYPLDKAWEDESDPGPTAGHCPVRKEIEEETSVTHTLLHSSLLPAPALAVDEMCPATGENLRTEPAEVDSSVSLFSLVRPGSFHPSKGTALWNLLCDLGIAPRGMANQREMSPRSPSPHFHVKFISQVTTSFPE